MSFESKLVPRDQKTSQKGGSGNLEDTNRERVSGSRQTVVEHTERPVRLVFDGTARPTAYPLTDDRLSGIDGTTTTRILLLVEFQTTSSQ